MYKKLQYGGSYQELISSSENTAAKSLGSFISKSKANGGYYIGRYEASYKSGSQCYSKKSTTTRTDESTALTSGMLWNYITQPNAATVAYNSFTNRYVISDLVNSYSWDTAIIFIQKYSGKPEYCGSRNGYNYLRNTGTNDDEVCNIHDMAANSVEWTTEYSSYWQGPWTCRGGNWRIASTPSSRNGIDSGTFEKTGVSFRLVLYIN